MKDKQSYVAETDGTHSSGHLRNEERVSAAEDGGLECGSLPSNTVLDNLLVMQRTCQGEGGGESEKRQGGVRIMHILCRHANEGCWHTLSRCWSRTKGSRSFPGNDHLICYTLRRQQQYFILKRSSCFISSSPFITPIGGISSAKLGQEIAGGCFFGRR